jgi:hypothetical protein
MLDPARGRVALVCQIEQLPNPAYDFVVVQIIRMHPRLVGQALVLVPDVHPPLARLHTLANEVPGHNRSVQMIPWEQRHQLLHLPGQLWSLILGHSLVQNITDIAKCSTVGLFANVKPLLVPISERGIPGAVKVLLLHPIPEGQVHSTGNFGAGLGPLLP